jgi:hypothetical protein
MQDYDNGWENTLTRLPSATKQFAEKIGSARLIAALKALRHPGASFSPRSD